MKILITGASGFIGFHLATYLSSNKKNKIILVDNYYRGKKDSNFKELLLNKKNINFINLDLSKENAFLKLPKNINLMFHLAAINGTKNFYQIPYAVLINNTKININILNYLKLNNKTKTIFASSSEVYASTTNLIKNTIPSKEKIPISIDDISNPRYSYAISKIFGEAGFFALQKKYPIKFNIVRFHNIYGPRMGFDHVIPELFLKIKNNKSGKLVLNGSSNTRSFCYIDDAVRALEVVSKKFNNEIINIGNDNEEIKIFDLCKKILKISNKTKISISKKQSPHGSVKRRLPDLNKIKLKGYLPKINLNTGLEITLNWYEKNYIKKK